MATSRTDISAPEDLYLDLLKQTLTRMLFISNDASVDEGARPRAVTQHLVRWTKRLSPLYMKVAQAAFLRQSRVRELIARLENEYRRRLPVNREARMEGLDWPANAETMIGMKRLDNIQRCVTDVLERHVPGDLIETGVWRGGAAIFMRGVLKAYGDQRRIVWVADSFQGLPRPDPVRSPTDAGDPHWKFNFLAVDQATVRANFARYGLLDDQVRFIPGWFAETLPRAPIGQLAILRVDADMYASTMDVLRALYDKVAVGGYIIIDDYWALQPCKAAVDEFRTQQNITEPVETIDQCGAYWRRT